MSETVKLIIEIPKEEFEAVKELKAINIGGRGSGKGIIYACLNAVKNGTPLEEVRSEIKGMNHTIDCETFEVFVSQEAVLEILDNVGKAESEGTNDRT